MANENHLSDMEPIFRPLLESGGTFTLAPRGDSMRPTIVPGRDTVSIVALHEPAKVGDILFYQRPDGHFVLHRVLAVEKDGYTMCGDYQLDKEKGVSFDSVLGVVSKIQRPDGAYLRGTPAFDALGRTRLRNRPLRYLWRAIRRLGKK